MATERSHVEDVIANAICTAAVVAASYKSLKVFSTVRHLGIPENETPPNPIQLKEDNPKTPSAPSRWKRITNNKKLAAVASCVAGITIYVGFVLVFGYVLPRFTSAMFLNILWGTLEALLITSVMFRSLAIVFPTPTAVRYVREKDVLRIEQIAMPVNEPSPLHAARFRIAVAACLSACVMASLYYGSTALVSLVVAGWILHVTPGGLVLSVRRITQVYLAIIALIPMLVGLILFLVYLFASGGDETPSEPMVELSKPSDWIIVLMMTFQGAYPYVIPGVLCAITLRYEHLRDAEPVKRMATPAALPLAQIQSRPTPLFIASIVALFSSIAGLNALTIALPGLKAFSDAPVFQFFASTPAVIVAIAATAAYRGQAAEWWSYFEIWVPKPDEIGNIDSIEEALDAKH